MSALLGTLGVALLAASGLAIATSLVAAAAWPRLRRRWQSAHPTAAARRLWGLAVAPSLVPAFLVGLCLAPGLVDLAGGAADHCAGHPEHPHLCLAHPAMGTGAALPAVSLGLLAAVAVGLGAAARRVAAAGRALSALRAAASGEVAPGARRVDTAIPFSLTAGLFRPEVFLSSALVERLSPSHLEVVVAHERSHARRRDALRLGLARLLSAPQLPRVRREVLASLALASERCCDEDAAHRVGDRLRVAEAILAVERLSTPAPPAVCSGVSAFGGSSVPERVRGLLTASAVEVEPLRLRWALAAVAGAAVLAAPVHHLAEHLLSRILVGP